VKKAREALEKARRALAEADERYDKAVQNARKKPSSGKKPDKPDDKKRPDKGR
jgi:F0F1-type ATP synthase membrane subunit b/b'